VQIIRANHAGFCFGVERAYELARNARDKKIYMIGELIHNPEVLTELKNKGIKIISSSTKISEGTVIVRAHGISNKKMREFKKKNLKIIDASCPFVKRIHTEVARFVKKKIPIVIVGRRNHPEMRAVIEDFPEILVVTNSSDPRLKKIQDSKVSVLAQTTESAEKFIAVVQKLKTLKTQVFAIATICNATKERQSAAIALAQKADLMLVIGGRKSNNTRQLWQLTKKITPSFWIENENEICSKWFAKIKKVGITAGASTPEKMIRRVVAKIKNLKPQL